MNKSRLDTLRAKTSEEVISPWGERRSSSLLENDSILPSFLGGTKERQRGRSKNCFSKTRIVTVGPQRPRRRPGRSTTTPRPPRAGQSKEGEKCERKATRSEEERGRHRERDRKRYHASRQFRRGYNVAARREFLTATASALVAAGGSCGRGAAVEVAAIQLALCSRLRLRRQMWRRLVEATAVEAAVVELAAVESAAVETAAVGAAAMSRGHQRLKRPRWSRSGHC